MTIKLDSLELKMTSIQTSYVSTIMSNKNRLKDTKKVLDLKIEQNNVRIHSLEDKLRDLYNKYENLIKVNEEKATSVPKVSLGDSSEDAVQVTSSSDEEEGDKAKNLSLIHI